MRRFLATIVSVLIATGPTCAGDAPVAQIRDGRLHPATLEVHVGEVVRWQAPPDRVIRIELDRHPTAHEVAERAGDIYAIFRKTGEHSYVVTILPAGERLRGTVKVSEDGSARPPKFECSDGGSGPVCFMR